MFGYFFYLFKSIKDILIKKNSNCEIKFFVNGYKGVSNKMIVIFEGVIVLFFVMFKLGFGIDEMYDLNFLLCFLFFGILNIDIVFVSDMVGIGRLFMIVLMFKFFLVMLIKFF